MNFDIKTEQLSDRRLRDLARRRGRPLHGARVQAAAARGDRPGRKQVIVDFSSTTFIDSTTLGVLVGGVKRLRTNDGQLSLVCSDREHHEDLRDHRARPGLRDLRDRDEAVSKPRQPSPNRSRRPEAAPRSSPFSLPSRSLASGLRRRRTRHAAATRASGKQLFLRPASRPSRRAPRATRSRTRGRQARSGRTSTTRSRRDKEQGFSQQTMRGRRARPDRLPRGADAGEPRTRAGRRRRRALRRAVLRATRLRRHRANVTASADHDGATAAADGGRGPGRQAGLRLGRLRRLSHAEGRRLDRHCRPEPRPAEAVRDDRATPGRGRRWRDARLQGHADGRRDQGRREVRQLRRRELIRRGACQWRHTAGSPAPKSISASSCQPFFA